MSEESNKKDQNPTQPARVPTIEELRKRAQEVLDKANELIQETGRQRGRDLSGQGDTKK